MLLGKSICDLFLSKPRKVLDTCNDLRKSSQMVQHSRHHSKRQQHLVDTDNQALDYTARIVDFLLEDNMKRKEKFLEVKLLRYHHTISEDFNYVSQMERAVAMGQTKSAEIILTCFKETLDL